MERTGEIEVDPPELVTNKPVLDAFHFLITRPFCNACLLIHIFLLTTCISTSYYPAMKQESVNLEPYNTRLKSVVESLQHDFDTEEGMLTDLILIWSTQRRDALLNRDQDFLDLQQDIQNHLSHLQGNKRSCKNLTWADPNFAPSNDAALIQLDMKIKASFGHRNQCLYTIRKYVDSLDHKMSGHLKLAMAGPHSVVDASYDECDEGTMRHLLLSTPFLAALLIMGVGTIPRALTPFLCLAGSVQASRCAIVLLKSLWEDLNMVGPDTQILFVQLALCFDYALFFWVRFSQERQQRPGNIDAQSILMRTLQTSGFVIFISTMVLVVAFLGASCYPDLNKLGYLYATLNLALGTLFVGFYSLTVPTVLASIWPNLFDDPKGSFLQDGLQGISRFVKARVFRPVGYVASSKPLNYLATVLVLATFGPLILNMLRLEPNYDYTETDFSTSVREYDAYNMVNRKFDLQDMHKMTVFMEASPALRDHFSKLSSESGDQMDLAFHKAACLVARTISMDKVCKSMGIPDKILSIDWDAADKSCLNSIQHIPGDERYRARNHTKERMFLFPEIDDLQGKDVQKLVRHFWRTIEPEVAIRNGERMLFSATLYTPVAEDMLLEQQYRHAAPWIVGVTIFIVCFMVGWLFKSYFVAVKMVFTVALPVFAEYGFAVGVFQHGWFAWAGIPSAGCKASTMPLQCEWPWRRQDHSSVLLARSWW
ncbi:unnamed protein product [Durusdinium trenchii]|uniref:Membrane transport protein MMPL domain-containing protein n=1 Tax=Durusdinium trenchii TaxID=1381693 RepID=A0ABP0MG60_9DINO